MATQYVEADRHRLELVAELHQQFWTAADRGDSLTTLAAEIRHQETAFGLSPMDRRRLQWEIQRTEAAERKKSQPKPPKRTADPRKALKVVK